MQLVSKIIVTFCAVITVSCDGNYRPNTVASATTQTGVAVEVYTLKNSDPALLGLCVRPGDSSPKYYAISMSPDVGFGQLKLRIEMSKDEKFLWISGSSSAVRTIQAMYDLDRGKFFTPAGVAATPSPIPDMESMLFEGSPFPKRSGEVTIIFDGNVSE